MPSIKSLLIFTILFSSGGAMAVSKHVDNSIDYIEFTVTDMTKAKSFYSAAFGWKFNDYGPTYAGIQKDGGGEIGGFTQGKSVSPGGPLVALYSNNLEGALKKVTDAGGKITKPIFSFPGGRRFHFQDPSGNELAVWMEQ